MSAKLVAVFLFGLGLLSLSFPSFSHHGSNIVYDLTQEITITGIVTDFRFVNPHTLIYFDVMGENGVVISWLAGLSSSSSLAPRDGWTRDTLSPGDQISIVGAPARGDAPSVWVGQVFLNGEPLLRGLYTG
jgi:hypothetical protein